tara:strand:- start:4573 stop:4776 length:204 start_codon:yes stop_codon:yes gene_type:complete
MTDNNTKIVFWGATDGSIDIITFVIDEEKYDEDDKKATEYMEQNYEEWGSYTEHQNILIDIKNIDEY